MPQVEEIGLACRIDVGQPVALRAGHSVVEAFRFLGIDFTKSILIVARKV